MAQSLGMRPGIDFEVAPEDRLHLDRIVGDRDSYQKHTARARAIQETAYSCGTLEIICLRTARGRCRLLVLHLSGLAPPTPCRSPGALTYVRLSHPYLTRSSRPF